MALAQQSDALAEKKARLTFLMFCARFRAIIVCTMSRPSVSCFNSKIVDGFKFDFPNLWHHCF